MEFGRLPAVGSSGSFFQGLRRRKQANCHGAAVTFFGKSGITLSKDDGSLYNSMIEFAQKRLDKNGLAAVLIQQIDKSN